MATDAEILARLGNSSAIFAGSPRSNRQFFVQNIKPIRSILGKEQAAIRASGSTERKITGSITIPSVTMMSSTSVPIEIVIGAEAAATGPSDGENAKLYQQQAGYILIAMGGNGVSHISATSDGGDAICVGAGDSLIVALGGHAATPSNPNPMPLGSNGTAGGDGGNAWAHANQPGSVIHAYGGNGKKGSRAGNGRRSKSIFGYTYRPLINAGIWGDDGDGGDAIASDGDSCDLVAIGGRVAKPVRLRYATPGNPGRGGQATVIHGPNDVKVFDSLNGDGSAGRDLIV